LKGGNERQEKHIVFRECRIVLADLDLLGVLMCRGDIASAVCYPNAVELERTKRDKTRQFDLPEDHNPLEECLGFRIQMIHPGGEIVVFARDFELF
jgi:hypothetical protein